MDITYRDQVAFVGGQTTGKPEFASENRKNGTFVISVSSAGHNGENFAKITINDVAVSVAPNPSGHDRGLHITVVNPSNGKLEFAKVFDTYKDLDDFATFVAISIPDGYIVAAACKDECMTNLVQAGKDWFAAMGSQEISDVGYR